MLPGDLLDEATQLTGGDGPNGALGWVKAREYGDGRAGRVVDVREGDHGAEAGEDVYNRERGRRRDDAFNMERLSHDGVRGHCMTEYGAGVMYMARETRRPSGTTHAKARRRGGREREKASVLERRTWLSQRRTLGA